MYTPYGQLEVDFYWNTVDNVRSHNLLSKGNFPMAKEKFERKNPRSEPRVQDANDATFIATIKQIMANDTRTRMQSDDSVKQSLQGNPTPFFSSSQPTTSNNAEHAVVPSFM